jgi:GT2 family glycosyltransferase
LNNDTVVDRDVLAELVRTAEGNQRVGVVGSKILHYYDIGTIQYLGYGRVKLNYAVFPYQGQADFSLNDCRVKGYITGASFLINKDIVAKVGLWDEKFFMSAEDLEYSYRIHKSGYLLYVSPRSRIFHKDGASTGRQTTVRYFLWRNTLRTAFNSFYIAGYYDMRNWIYFYRKHKGIFFLIFYYSVFLPFFFLAVCFFILIFDDHKRERIWHVSDAFKDGLRGVMGARRS